MALGGLLQILRHAAAGNSAGRAAVAGLARDAGEYSGFPRGTPIGRGAGQRRLSSLATDNF